MNTCFLLILLILLIIVLFYLFSKLFVGRMKEAIPEIRGGDAETQKIDKAEQQLSSVATKLSNPSISTQDLISTTYNVAEIIKEIDSVRYYTINLPLMDRCIELTNKFTDLYKDRHTIESLQRIIPTLYTVRKDIVMDFADNLLLIYTHVKYNMSKSDNDNETIDKLMSVFRKLSFGEMLIPVQVPPPSTPPPSPPLPHSSPSPPSTPPPLPPTTSTVPSTPPPPTHASMPRVSNEEAKHSGHNIEPFTPNGIKINTSAIQASPVQLPAQALDVVFPGTNTSIYRYDELDLLDEYAQIWKFDDPNTFNSLKYKYNMIKRTVVEHSNAGESEDEELDPFLIMDDEVVVGDEDTIIPVREVLSPQSRLYNFSKILINAAAANLKTNQGYIIQHINHVDSLIIVGDMHGDLPALLLCLRKYISILRSRPDTCLAFLGDYIDRGAASADIVFVISLLKVMFPSRIYLCRGNHEDSIAYNFGGNFTGFTMLNSLEKRAETTIQEVFYAYVSFVIFICSLSCVIADKSLLCTHGGFSQGCTYEMFVGKKLEFIPSLMSVDIITGNPYPIKCLMWEDYPYIDTNVDRGTGCRNLGPVGFDKMLQDNGFNLFVKGHVHNAAGSHIHEKDIADLYIIISSLFMTSYTVNGMIHYTADYRNNKMNSNTLSYGSIEKLMMAKRATASMLYVVFNTETNAFDQEFIPIIEGADNDQYLDHLHADIIAYFNEFFPVKNSIIQTPSGTPVDAELMKCYRTNIFAQPLRITHDKFKTLNDVIDVLNKAEGRS